MRLRAVLNQGDLAPPCQFCDPDNIRCAAIKMSEHGSTEAASDVRGKGWHTHAIRPRVDIDKDGVCAHRSYRSRAVHAGVGNRRHCIAWTNPKRAQRQLQCVRAVTNTHTDLRPAVRCEFLLKGFHLRPKHIPSTSHDAVNNAEQFLAQSIGVPQEIIQRNPSHLAFPISRSPLALHPKATRLVLGSDDSIPQHVPARKAHCVSSIAFPTNRPTSWAIVGCEHQH